MNNLQNGMKLLVVVIIVALTAIQLWPAKTTVAQGQPTERVQFARGATQATLEGTLTADGNVLYLLNASKGQQMWIYVDQVNWDNDLSATLIAPNGFPAGSQAFEGGTILAESGEYAILLQSTTGVDYIVTVGIENQQSTPAHPPVPQPDPGLGDIQFERISFAPGATSAVRHGTVGMNGTILYTLNAAEGQQMDVTVSGDPNVAVALRGPRTMPLEGGSQQKWSGRLPGTGTYEIAVSSTLGAFEKNFKLHVSIVTPKAPAPEPDQGPGDIQFERINFRPGATSAVRYGTVSMNGTILYTLNAAEGQQMDVILSGNPNVALALRGPQTMPLEAGSQQQWSGRLPGTGTYEIAVYSTLGAFDKNFKLHVSITTPAAPKPVQEQVKRVYFQRGATSAIRYGTVGMNESTTYILGASAGQRMNVTVSGSSQVGMEVYSPSGDYLFSFEPRNWSGTLPESGDYRIKVASAAGVYDKNFKVSFSIR